MDLPYNIPKWAIQKRTQDRGHNRTTSKSPTVRASFKGICPGQSYRALHLKGPYTGFHAPLYHLEILNNFQTKEFTFSFCTESYTLRKWVLFPRSHVFADCHWSQISATYFQVKTPNLRAVGLSLRNFNKNQKLGIEIQSENGRTLRASPAKPASEVSKATLGLSLVLDIQLLLGFHDLLWFLSNEFLFLLHLTVFGFCSLQLKNLNEFNQLCWLAMHWLELYNRS